MEFLSGIGQSANRVKVYVMDKNLEEAYVFASEPRQITEERIREHYPDGGKFHLKLFNNSHYITMRTVVLTPSITAQAAVNPAINPAGNNSDINLLREQINRQHEMLLSMIQQASKAAPTAGPGIVEIITAVREMSALAPKPPDLTTIFPGMLDMMKSFMDLAKDSVPGAESDWKSGLLKVAGNALEKLPLLLGAMKMGKQPNGPESAAAGPADADAMAKAAIDYLKPKALARKNVLVLVDFLADNFDNPEYHQLALVLLNRPFADFEKLDPEIGQEPCKTWFLTLYTELKKVIANESSELIAGPGGSDSDPSGDETPDN